MHAHRDVPLAAAYDELDVDAVGVDRRVVARRRRAAARRRRASRRTRPRAGCPCRRGGPARCGRRPTTLVSPSTFGVPMSTVIRSPSTVSVLTPSRVSTADRRGAVGEALVDQVAGEEPDAVAAHLRERAVGVAVVHEPLGVRRGRADHPQHAVAADAGAAVAERAHPLAARRGRRGRCRRGRAGGRSRSRCRAP